MNRPQVIGPPRSHEQFSRGFNIIADLLATTLGPSGGNIVSESERSTKYEYLNDSSVAVRRILSLGTPQLDIGAMAMRNLVWNIGQRAGDGGATTAVLSRAIYNEGKRLVAAGVNAMQLTRGINRALVIVKQELRAQARPVVGEDDLAAVARTITNEDDLAAVLGEMGYLLGPDSHLIIEKYVAPYLQRRYLAGAHYKAKISSMYFYTDVGRRTAVMTAPAIALIDGRLTEADQVVPLLESALANGAKALTIIAQDVTGSALSVLVTNHTADKEKKKLDILAVKLSEIGDALKLAKTDLALMTGATIFGDLSGHRLTDARPDDLGKAQRVEYGSNAIVIVAEAEKRAAVRDEVTKLRALVEKTRMDDEERPKLVKRMATLTGGVGELKIGTYNKTERAMLEKLAERAYKVLTSAQRNGVVPGAGASLYYCALKLDEAIQSGSYDEDVTFGMQVMSRALAAPLRQIVRNTGLEQPSVIMHRLSEAGIPATYDAITGQIVDAFEAGVLDVADVVVHVLEAAVSGAMMGLSTDAIVYHRKPKQELTP